ncbi:beta-N-acetylhexosaminidase [Agromyces sp. LHK192]|uniref:beta-N-acetylhexosaminidase n=1 Tax=Agromyces sp. LHK192 TaxID=2498704 RepID=UPI0013E3F422|nr:beta-N-acetylhexosaminidase [Agromyces sp. LHK192]
MTTGIVPLPASAEYRPDDTPFRLAGDTKLVASGDGAAAIAELLADRLRGGTGYDLPVVDGMEGGASDIVLVVRGASAGESTTDPAADAYTLETGADGARIEADAASGLFRGTQSLLQLLPPDASGRTPAPADGFAAVAASVDDRPRFAYRGASLDVARHFMPVDDVLSYIDAIAFLKFNVLHLHLTDDQGWRIRIDAWPQLTDLGGQTAVWHDEGGYYTKDDYRRIVEYAAARSVTVVPEIDLPGHTNAALSSVPELNCDGVATEPYHGIEVGFSSLCASPERAEVTDRFLADVLGEVAAMTPGPWLHVGGDESHATSPEDYVNLVDRITATGAATGKTVIGWHEIGASRNLPPGTIGQYWGFVGATDDAEGAPGDEAAAAAETLADTRSFVEQGGRVIFSPADVAYLDMKYVEDPQNALGQDIGLQWAKGPTTLEEAYGWEPADIVPGVGEADILGVEAPIWTETLRTMDDVEFMAFPRITGIAEIAWSPRVEGGRDEEAFVERVAGLAPYWDAAGVEFYRIRGIDWR